MDSLAVNDALHVQSIWGVIAAVIVVGGGIVIAMIKGFRGMGNNAKDFLLEMFKRDDKRHEQFIIRGEKIKDEIRQNHKEIMDRVGGLEKDWIRGRNDLDRRLSKVENDIQNLSNNGRERNYPK